MSSAIIVNGQKIKTPKGITCTNYIDHGEPSFRKRKRNRWTPLKHLVLHETAGNTAEGCKRTLIKKKLGVQLILDRNGHLSCHGDLAREWMWHANQVSKTSIGIEVVNPYAPTLARGEFDTIPAQWWTWTKGGDRRYVLPTGSQMDVLMELIPWLCSLLKIPYEFPTIDLGPGQRKIKGWSIPPRKKPKPGIVAHSDFSSHADGRYLLEAVYRVSKNEGVQ